MEREHKTKQAIKTAARSLFAKQGYNAVSVRDIADAIGKQPGGIYNHFDAKQSILFTLMQQTMERIQIAQNKAFDETVSAKSQLRNFIQTHLSFNIDNPDDLFLSYMELRSLEGENASDIIKLRDDYEAMLRTILERGVASNEFTILNPQIHARALISMTIGITFWYREGGPRSRQEVLDSYINAALQSVGLQAQPA